MKLFYALSFFTIFHFSVNAQEVSTKKIEQLADFTIGFGSSQTTVSAGYVIGT